MRHIRFLKNEVERLKKSLRTTELQRKWLSSFPREAGLWRGRCPQGLIKDMIGNHTIRYQVWVVFHRPKRLGYILASSHTVYMLVTFHRSHYTWIYLRVNEEELLSGQQQASKSIILPFLSFKRVTLYTRADHICFSCPFFMKLSGIVWHGLRRDPLHSEAYPTHGADAQIIFHFCIMSRIWYRVSTVYKKRKQH